MWGNIIQEENIIKATGTQFRHDRNTEHSNVTNWEAYQSLPRNQNMGYISGNIQILIGCK